RTLAEPAPAHETELGIEIVADDEVVGGGAENVGIVDEASPIALVVPLEPRRARPGVVGEEVRLLGEPEECIRAPRLVGLSGRGDRFGYVLEDHAHVAPGEQIAPEPEDRGVRRNRAHLLVLGGLDVEQADIERTDLASETP